MADYNVQIRATNSSGSATDDIVISLEESPTPVISSLEVGNVADDTVVILFADELDDYADAINPPVIGDFVIKVNGSATGYGLSNFVVGTDRITFDVATSIVSGDIVTLDYTKNSRSIIGPYSRVDIPYNGVFSGDNLTYTATVIGGFPAGLSFDGATQTFTWTSGAVNDVASFTDLAVSNNVSTTPAPKMTLGFESLEPVPIDSPSSIPFRLSGDQNPAEVSTDFALTGTQSLKCLVPLAAPSGLAPHRAEIQHKGGTGSPTTVGSEHVKFTTRTYGWSMYIPSTFQFDPVEDYVMQLKNFPDPTEGGDMFSIRLQNSVIKYNSKYNEDDPHSGSTSVFGNINGDFTRGVWHSFVLEYHYDYRESGGNGYFKIWYKENGVIDPGNDLIVNQTTPTGFNDAVGPYFKVGMYKGLWSSLLNRNTSSAAGVTERLIYIDDIFIQEGTFISSGGSPTYALNEDFDDWTGDDPDGWTIGGESGANEITEGTPGKLQLISDGTNVTATISGVLTTSTDYNFEIKVDEVTSGSVRVNAIGGTSVTIHSSPSTGTLSGSFNSGNNTDVQIKRNSGTTNFFIDYIYIWEA